MLTEKVPVTAKTEQEWNYISNVYKSLYGSKNIIDINRELGYIEVIVTEDNK